MSTFGNSGEPSHGERSASGADAKKDREPVGQMPKDATLRPFTASESDDPAWLQGKNSGGHEDTGIGTDGAARSAARPAHPCLSCNTYIEDEEKNHRARLSPYQKRVAQLVTWKVELLAKKYGVERLLVVHLTPREAWGHNQWARAFKGLLANVISSAYSDYLLVMERGTKGGRLHGHLVVACKEDVRTGYNFAAREAAKKRGPRARWRTDANAALRNEMKRWDCGKWGKNERRWTGTGRQLAYGFGYTRVEPVVSGQGLGYYLGGYMSKSLANRVAGDEGRRLVRSSKGLNNFTVHFQFLNVRAWLYRQRLAAFCALNGISDLDELAAKAGRRWAYDLARVIYGIPLKRWRTLRFYDGRSAVTKSASMVAQMDGETMQPGDRDADEISISFLTPNEVRWGWLNGWQYRYEVSWFYTMTHAADGTALYPEAARISNAAGKVFTFWNSGGAEALPDGNPF